MASLTAEQFEALDQRRSNQDLQDILAILRRDGEVSIEGGAPAPAEGEELSEEAEARRDTEIQNSQLLAEPVNLAPSEEELAGNLEAAKAAGEFFEEPPAGQAQGSSSGNSGEYPSRHAELDELALANDVEWDEGVNTVQEKQDQLRREGVSPA